ncbi:hypothetical protein GCK72_025543 [Caenorhabditis remanei]|uniref:Uncharacterized protein n=1 Tax=Caenorhabditis remanei TaxID=31234 RepID=A0A6A5G2B8_CAERE|nr:hypothetical protein GCK72_025543 [Caenorhabditis remanei]KAF1749076.1 hypothetical protein GCK72_025543 [Caenorhabditis remanei]
MNILLNYCNILISIKYVSPGCLSQCVNCAPQPTYQYVLNVPSNYVQVPTTSNQRSAACCVPTSNVQTIQSARAFTNGAQGSQVIMYYNGQRVVSGAQPTQQPQAGSNFNQANNYQNPGPIPGYQTGYDQNQNQNQNQTGYYPNSMNGGVVAGGATTGTVVIGGVTQQQGNQGINAGGNVPNQNTNAGGNIDPNSNQYQDQFQNQNQNADPYQNQQNYNTGGVVGNVGNQNQNQNQFQNQTQNQGPGQQYQNQNQNQFQTQDQNINGPGYVDQNQYQTQNQDQGQNINTGGYVDNQNQGQFQDQNQGQFQGSTLAPSGGEVGYQQPFVQSGNTDYNNGAGQGQFDQQGQQGQFQQNQNDQQVIYPAGGVVGGSYNSPNSGYVNSQVQPVQPQTYPTQTVTGGALPNQNVQQQPDVNTQYQDQMNQQNQQGQNQGGQNFQQGNQQGFIGSSTAPQGQQFTSAPNNQFQQSTSPQGQLNNGGFVGSSTPGYQQGGQQQQFTTSPGQQQNFNDGQQGYTENTLTPPVMENDNSQFTQGPTTPAPIPVIYPVSGAGQQTQQPQQFQQTPQPQPQYQQDPNTQQSPQPIQTTPIYQPTPVPNPDQFAGQESQAPTQQVSSNQDESQNDVATSQAPNFVPVPVPQNNNNGNVPMESTTQFPNIGTQPVTESIPSGQFIGGVPVGQTSTNSFQSTTPTTTTNNFGGQQPSTGFQPTTGMPVTNDMNQSGFISSSTMDPNMPQAQYPSQQEILAATGQQADQSATSGANMVSTQAPQFPSQQELGATLQNAQPTPSPQFPAQQQMGGGATTQNSNFNSQQDGSTQQAQFPSQQELLQRDQQNSGVTGQPINVCCV